MIKGRKGGKPSTRPRRPPNGERRDHPTVVLKSHTLIAQSLTNVNIKQLNIVPSLGITGPDILEQARFFQLYRILRVTVQFFNLDPVNYLAGTGATFTNL